MRMPAACPAWRDIVAFCPTVRSVAYASCTGVVSSRIVRVVPHVRPSEPHVEVDAPLRPELLVARRDLLMFCGLCHISILPYYRFAVSFGMFGMFQRFAPSPAAVAFALPIIQGAQSFFAGPHPKAGRGYGGVWAPRGIIR